MKMKISSVETHKRTHTYRFEQRELERLALEKVATELGLDLSHSCLKAESKSYQIHKVLIRHYMSAKSELKKAWIVRNR